MIYHHKIVVSKCWIHTIVNNWNEWRLYKKQAANVAYYEFKIKLFGGVFWESRPDEKARIINHSPSPSTLTAQRSWRKTLLYSPFDTRHRGNDNTDNWWVSSHWVQARVSHCSLFEPTEVITSCLCSSDIITYQCSWTQKVEHIQYKLGSAQTVQ